MYTIAPAAAAFSIMPHVQQVEDGLEVLLSVCSFASNKQMHMALPFWYFVIICLVVKLITCPCYSM